MTHYELHYMLPVEIDRYEDVHYVSEYRGKYMRSYSTVLKAKEQLLKEQPQAYAFEIAEYDDELGIRID